MYATTGKRFFDVLCGTLLLWILSPVFLAITILGVIAHRGNPFFIQERIGLNEKAFKLIKFKTMNNRRDTDGNLLPDGQRLTRYGRALRSTSLDESPQLLNVIKGDMSFIGPRPLLVRYLPYYSDLERQRHSVRPGITGLAQTKGRNELDWTSRFAHDIDYSQNVTLKRDLAILARTIRTVTTASGMQVDVTATALRDLDVDRRG